VAPAAGNKPAAPGKPAPAPAKPAPKDDDDFQIERF
jgi:hypothetical protein